MEATTKTVILLINQFYFGDENPCGNGAHAMRGYHKWKNMRYYYSIIFLDWTNPYLWATPNWKWYDKK